MGKVSKKKARDDDNGEVESLLKTMKIAQAVLNNDARLIGEILEASLPMTGVAVQNVSIEKSVGESFTGGRSTPVYFVTADVVRNGVSKSRSFVVKLVIMPEDDDVTMRRRESYMVERRFYDYFAGTVKESGLIIPKLIAGDLDGSKPSPVFCILLTDLRAQFSLHPDVLDTNQVKCALLWLAKFHAIFWKQRTDFRGAYWTTKLVSTEGVSSSWVKTIKYMEQKHPEMVNKDTKSLGIRLQNAGNAISRLLERKSSEHGCLLHGDYKAANIFFRETKECSSDSVAVLDFQFTGVGVPAEDVAYLLYPDARGDFLDHEEELLRLYHEELIFQLMSFCKGGPSTLSFDLFHCYYELSRLDLTRYWLSAKGWSASTRGEAELVCSLTETMNKIDEQVLNDSEYDAALERFLTSD